MNLKTYITPNEGTPSRVRKEGSWLKFHHRLTRKSLITSCKDYFKRAGSYDIDAAIIPSPGIVISESAVFSVIFISYEPKYLTYLKWYVRMVKSTKIGDGVIERKQL